MLVFMKQGFDQPFSKLFSYFSYMEKRFDQVEQLLEDKSSQKSVDSLTNTTGHLVSIITRYELTIVNLR